MAFGPSQMNLGLLVTPYINQQALNSMATAAGASFGNQFQVATSRTSQPLGRITGQISDFQRSMAAANARVLAFGASAGSIYLINDAFKKMVSSTIEVEKSLSEVNVVLGLGQTELKSFSNEMFKAASQTGQTFQTASKVALEFARHGVAATETTKRMVSAMQLMRISGLGVEDSVAAITAAINSFNKEGLTSEDVVNRMTAVDMKFAVSAQDLAKAIERVGTTAVDAGVKFNQLLGLVTAVQTATSRGGAVIGNAFKSIFTRLSRPEVLGDLEAVGITTKNASGQVLPMIEIMKRLASQYDSLSFSQKSFVSESVGGVYQMNILKASLADLGRGFSIYEKATITAGQSTGMIEKRMASLNDTISAKVNTTVLLATRLFSSFGQVGFGTGAKSGLDSFNSQIELWSSALDEVSDKSNIGEKIGKSIVQGAVKGLGDLISGPGVQIAAALVAKIARGLGGFAYKSGREVMGLNDTSDRQKAIQESVHNLLSQNVGLVDLWKKGQIDLNSMTAIFLSTLKETNAQYATLAAASKAISIGASGAVSFKAHSQTNSPAAGFVPSFRISSEEGRETERALAASHKGGYRPGPVVPKLVWNGHGGAEYTLVNQAENVKQVTVDGHIGTMVMPPNGLGAGTRYAAKGFVPNFYPEKRFRNPPASIGKGAFGTVYQTKGQRGGVPTVAKVFNYLADQRDIEQEYKASKALEKVKGKVSPLFHFPRTLGKINRVILKQLFEGETIKKFRDSQRGLDNVGSIDEFIFPFQKLAADQLHSAGINVDDLLGHSANTMINPKSAEIFKKILSKKSLLRFRLLNKLNEVEYAERISKKMAEQGAQIALVDPGLFKSKKYSFASGFIPNFAESRFVNNIINSYKASLLETEPLRLRHVDRGQSYYLDTNTELRGMGRTHGHSIEKMAYSLSALSAKTPDNVAKKILKRILAGESLEGMSGVLSQNVKKARGILLSEGNEEDFSRILGWGAKTQNFAQGLLLRENFIGAGRYKNKTGKVGVMDSWALYVRNGGALGKDYDSRFATEEKKHLLFAQTKRGYNYYNRIHSEYIEAAKELNIPLSVLQGRTWGWARGQRGSKTRITGLASSGFVPSFGMEDNFLGVRDAFKRENSPTSALGFSPELKSPSNPLGMGVYDKSYQKNLQQAFSQHISLGETNLKSMGKNAAAGFVPNFGVMESLFLGGLQGSVTNLSGVLSRFSFGFNAKIEKERALISQYTVLTDKINSTEIVSYKGKTYDRNTSAGGPDVGARQREFSTDFRTNNPSFNPSPIAQSASTQQYEVYSRNQANWHNRITRAAGVAIIGGPMMGEMGASLAKNFGAPNLSKGLEEFSSGVMSAGQLLITFPNKIGTALAGGQLVKSSLDSLSISFSKFGKYQKAYDIASTRLEKMSSASNTVLESFERLKNASMDSSVSLSEYNAIQMRHSKALGELAATPNGGRELASALTSATTEQQRREAVAAAVDKANIYKGDSGMKMQLAEAKAGTSIAGWSFNKGHGGRFGGFSDAEKLTKQQLLRDTAIQIEQSVMTSGRLPKDFGERMKKGALNAGDIVSASDEASRSEILTKMGFTIEEVRDVMEQFVYEISKFKIPDNVTEEEFARHGERLNSLRVNENSIRQKYNLELYNTLSKGSIQAGFANQFRSATIESHYRKENTRMFQREQEADLTSLTTADVPMIKIRSKIKERQIRDQTRKDQLENSNKGAGILGQSLSTAIEENAKGDLNLTEKKSDTIHISEVKARQLQYVAERQKYFGNNPEELLKISQDKRTFAEKFIGNKSKIANESGEGAGIKFSNVQYDTLANRLSTALGNKGTQESLASILINNSQITEKGFDELIRLGIASNKEIKEARFRELSVAVKGIDELQRGGSRKLRRELRRDEYTMNHSRSAIRRGEAARDLLNYIPSDERDSNNPTVKRLYDTAASGSQAAFNYIYRGTSLQGFGSSAERSDARTYGNYKGVNTGRITLASGTELPPINTSGLEASITEASKDIFRFGDRLNSIGTELEKFKAAIKASSEATKKEAEKYTGGDANIPKEKGVKESNWLGQGMKWAGTAAGPAAMILGALFAPSILKGIASKIFTKGAGVATAGAAAGAGVGVATGPTTATGAGITAGNVTRIAAGAGAAAGAAAGAGAATGATTGAAAGTATGITAGVGAATVAATAASAKIIAKTKVSAAASSAHTPTPVSPAATGSKAGTKQALKQTLRKTLNYSYLQRIASLGKIREYTTSEQRKTILGELNMMNRRELAALSKETGGELSSIRGQLIPTGGRLDASQAASIINAPTFARKIGERLSEAKVSGSGIEPFDMRKGSDIQEARRVTYRMSSIAESKITPERKFDQIANVIKKGQKIVITQGGEAVHGIERLEGKHIDIIKNTLRGIGYSPESIATSRETSRSAALYSTARSQINKLGEGENFWLNDVKMRLSKNQVWAATQKKYLLKILENPEEVEKLMQSNRPVSTIATGSARMISLSQTTPNTYGINSLKGAAESTRTMSLGQTVPNTYSYLKGAAESTRTMSLSQTVLNTYSYLKGAAESTRTMSLGQTLSKLNGAFKKMFGELGKPLNQNPNFKQVNTGSWGRAKEIIRNDWEHSFSGKLRSQVVNLLKKSTDYVGGKIVTPITSEISLGFKNFTAGLGGAKNLRTLGRKRSFSMRAGLEIGKGTRMVGGDIADITKGIGRGIVNPIVSVIESVSLGFKNFTAGLGGAKNLTSLGGKRSFSAIAGLEIGQGTRMVGGDIANIAKGIFNYFNQLMSKGLSFGSKTSSAFGKGLGYVGQKITDSFAWKSTSALVSEAGVAFKNTIPYAKIFGSKLSSVASGSRAIGTIGLEGTKTALKNLGPSVSGLASKFKNLFPSLDGLGGKLRNLLPSMEKVTASFSGIDSLKGAAKIGGKIAGAGLAYGFGAYEMLQGGREIFNGKDAAKGYGKAASGGGAIIGGILGSAFGPVGTVVGAVAGGLMGSQAEGGVNKWGAKQAGIDLGKEEAIERITAQRRERQQGKEAVDISDTINEFRNEIDNAKESGKGLSTEFVEKYGVLNVEEAQKKKGEMVIHQSNLARERRAIPASRKDPLITSEAQSAQRSKAALDFSENKNLVKNNLLVASGTWDSKDNSGKVFGWTSGGGAKAKSSLVYDPKNVTKDQFNFFKYKGDERGIPLSEEEKKKAAKDLYDSEQRYKLKDIREMRTRSADRVGDKTLWKKTEAREKQMAESISAADNVAKYGKYASPEALKIMSAQPKGMTPEAEALQKSAGDKDIKVSFDPATLTVILKDENGKTIQEVQTQLNSQQSQINAITGNIRPNEVKTKT